LYVSNALHFCVCWTDLRIVQCCEPHWPRASVSAKIEGNCALFFLYVWMGYVVLCISCRYSVPLYMQFFKCETCYATTGVVYFYSTKALLVLLSLLTKGKQNACLHVVCIFATWIKLFCLEGNPALHIVTTQFVIFLCACMPYTTYKGRIFSF